MSVHLLDKTWILAAAGQADIPGRSRRSTPKSSIRGLPSSITSSASVTTAPSMQPPETEPTKLPSVVDDELAADRPRRGAPGLDHGGDGDALAGRLPACRR